MKIHSSTFTTRVLMALICFGLAWTAMPGNSTAQDESPVVHVIEVVSAIGPISAEFITTSIDDAESEGAECLIVELDTPGGLLESTRQITKRFLSANVPVIVYVAPDGARAASAGVFISYAAHLVAMAPSTNIGAATPVNITGGSDTTSAMSHKITNDAVAQVKALADKRGRNAAWAEQAIREAVSVTANEALELNVINFISVSVRELLEQINGSEVETAIGPKTINTTNARVITKEMNFRYRLLNKIASPNIAYILMMLGIYGLFFELSNPGAIFPGVVGAIFLVLALFSLQTLPVNYAGLLLILLALILFILEVKIVSYGMLTIGGIGAMTLGSLMLFDQPPDNFAPAVAVSMKLILMMVGLTAAFFIFAFSLALKSHRKKVTTGAEGLVGEVGTAESSLKLEGRVKVHGEIWKARCDVPLSKGKKIRVVRVAGLLLEVEEV